MPVSVEVTVERPPREVFPVVADRARLPEWMEDFELGAPEPGLEWSESEPGHRVAWSGPPLRRGPGTLEPHGAIEVEPANGGSVVRVTLDPVARGALKLLMPVVRRSMRNSAVQNLSRLKALLER